MENAIRNLRIFTITDISNDQQIHTTKSKRKRLQKNTRACMQNVAENIYLPRLGFVQRLVGYVHNLLQNFADILFPRFLIRRRRPTVIGIHRLHAVRLRHHSNLRGNGMHHSALIVHALFNNTVCVTVVRAAWYGLRAAGPANCPLRESSAH